MSIAQRQRVQGDSSEKNANLLESIHLGHVTCRSVRRSWRISAKKIIAAQVAAAYL